MEQYLINYHKKFNITPGEFIPCEYCAAEGKIVASVNVHHVVPRSHFGNKRMDERDHWTNLCALCGPHHSQAHQGPDIAQFNDMLKEIVSKRNDVL